MSKQTGQRKTQEQRQSKEEANPSSTFTYLLPHIHTGRTHWVEV